MCRIASDAATTSSRLSATKLLPEEKLLPGDAVVPFDQQDHYGWEADSFAGRSDAARLNRTHRVRAGALRARRPAGGRRHTKIPGLRFVFRRARRGQSGRGPAVLQEQ